MIGQTISHYRIEARLGAGGMGDVYRATDSELNRLVAIKVVSEKMMADPELRRRFLQEAKTASALHHPHVVTIYEVGAHSGQHFIAMELIPGGTLEDKIGPQGLPVRQALSYAIQIADALHAAHALGIVHRDLKPSNVMVTGDDQVKILDFGLAKRDSPYAGAASDETEVLNTNESPLTEVGTIVGTVLYMSPEQAEGKPVDTRSDIFSFGSLLYEMLSGRKAFGGDSKVASLTAILHKEPTPLEAMPPRLTGLIQRCLRKDVARRAQSMADVRVELEDIASELDAPAVPAPVGPVPTRRWLLPALAGTALGLVPGAYLANRWATTPVPRFQRITFRRGDLYGARFAPGGNIVYSAEWEGAVSAVFVTQPGVREAREVGLPNCRLASVSSKGELAVIRDGLFQGSSGLLMRVPLGGGAPREMLEAVSAADWAPDGEQLAVARTVDGKQRVDFPIGTARYTVESRPIPSIRLSRDGRSIAFSEYDRSTGDYAVQVIVDRQPPRAVARGFRATSGIAFSPDDKEIWVGGTRLGQEPAVYGVDIATGRERVVTQTPGWPFVMDVSADGTLLLGQANTRLGIHARVPSAPEGRELAWYEASLPYDITASGDAVIFLELSYGEGRNSAIFYRKTDGATAVRLGYGNRPALSPDGRWVACVRREGTATTVALLPTGAGEARTLTPPGLAVETVEWFPGGDRLLLSGVQAKGKLRSWVCDVANGAVKPVTPEGQRAQAPSPDDRVVVRRGTGYVLLDLARGDAAQVPGLKPGDTVMRASGRHLLVRCLVGKNLEIARVGLTGGQRDVLHTITPVEPGATFLPNMAISPDGQWWACSYQRDLATLYTLSGLA